MLFGVEEVGLVGEGVVEERDLGVVSGGWWYGVKGERGAYLVVSNFIELQDCTVASFLVGADNCNNSRLRVIRQSALGELPNLPQQRSTKDTTELLNSWARPLCLHESLKQDLILSFLDLSTHSKGDRTDLGG